MVSQEHAHDWGTGLVTTESLLPAAYAWDAVASRAVRTAWRPRGFSTAASIFPFWLHVSHKDHSQRLPTTGLAACAQLWLWRESRVSPNLRSWQLVALICVSGAAVRLVSRSGPVFLAPLQVHPKTGVWPVLPLSRLRSLGSCPLLSSPRRASHLTFHVTQPCQLAEDGPLCLPCVLCPSTSTITFALSDTCSLAPLNSSLPSAHDLFSPAVKGWSVWRVECTVPTGMAVTASFHRHQRPAVVTSFSVKRSQRIDFRRKRTTTESWF